MIHEPITVAALVEVYLTHEGQRGDSRTLSDRQLILGRFCEAHGNRPVSDCRPADLLLWIPLYPAWKSDWTIRRVIATVHRPFSWGRRLGLVAVDPFAGIGHRTGEPMRPMADEEFHALLGAAKLPFQRILRFLRWTGARPCEARSLLWTQVEPEQGIAVLQIHKTSRTRRDRAPRLIALSEPIFDLFVEILTAPGAVDTGHVFFNAKRKPWTRNAFNLQMQRLRAKCGIGPTCKLYGLRHRYGTLAAASGVDLKGLAELMGHTTTRMTEHYIHLAGRADLLHQRLQQIEGL